MIAEREIHLSDDDLHEENFPRFLVLRRAADVEEGGEEWQGFIKDIKYTIKTNSSKTSNDLN